MNAFHDGEHLPHPFGNELAVFGGRESDIDPNERLQVAVELGIVIGRAFNTYPDNLRHDSIQTTRMSNGEVTEVSEDGIVTHLNLCARGDVLGEPFSRHGYLGINLQQTSQEIDHVSPAKISVTHYDRKNKPDQSVSYYRDAAGTVRRSDKNHMYIMATKLDPKSRRQRRAESWDKAENDWANSQLELAMNLNNQPVGLGELHWLGNNCRHCPTPTTVPIPARLPGTMCLQLSDALTVIGTSRIQPSP